MTVDLRVVSGFERLQVIPPEGRERAQRENQQDYQYNSLAYAVEPWISARSAMLSFARFAQFAQFDEAAEILAESLRRALNGSLESVGSPITSELPRKSR